MTSSVKGVDICGGWIGNERGIRECFRLLYNNKTWIRSPTLPSLNQRRVYSASVRFNNTWWIVGGWNVYDGYQDTIEARNEDDTWTIIDLKLPRGMGSHCVVKIDENRNDLNEKQ